MEIPQEEWDRLCDELRRAYLHAALWCLGCTCSIIALVIVLELYA